MESSFVVFVGTHLDLPTTAVKKFPTFYGTRMFIIMFTGIYHLSLS
jgi:hypothetical protein